jgi:hypothetical protein
MNEGWIKLHRKMTDWEWYTDANTFRLFMHLLITANHADKNWRGTVIKAGQRVVGRATLAAEIKLTEQQIRTALNRLKSTNEITIQTTNRFTLVTIVNWGVYQEINQQVTSKTTSSLTNKQPTDNQQITTTKECKNNKNERKEREGVSASPKPQPRKIGKRLGEEWWVPDEWGEWAMQEFNWNVEKVVKVAEVFKDHWLSQGGSKGVKLNWESTWRNWCRRENEGF